MKERKPVINAQEYTHNLAWMFAATIAGAIILILGFSEGTSKVLVVLFAGVAGVTAYFAFKTWVLWGLRDGVEKYVIQEFHYGPDVLFGELEEVPKEDPTKTNEIAGPLATLMYCTADKNIQSTDWLFIYEHLHTSDTPSFSRRALKVDAYFYSVRKGDNQQSFPDIMIKMGAARKGENGYEWVIPQSRAIIKQLLLQLGMTPPLLQVEQNPVAPPRTTLVQEFAPPAPPAPPTNGAGEVAESDDGELTVWDVFPESNGVLQ